MHRQRPFVLVDRSASWLAPWLFAPLDGARTFTYHRRMVDASSAARSAAPGGRRGFVLRKLHSLSGVVPLGLFVVLHLYTNAQALSGRRSFEDAVRTRSELPYAPVLELVFIGLPLLFHALYGIKLSLSARPNVGRYSTTRNWMYLLQRISGVLTLAFVAYHLWQFRLQVALGNMARGDLFPELCAQLSSTTWNVPFVAMAYLVGVAATVFHFTNGLYGFCFSWGITISERASRAASGAFGVVGVVLFVLGANTVIYFATGSALFLPDRPPGPGTAQLSCQPRSASEFELSARDTKGALR